MRWILWGLTCEVIAGIVDLILTQTETQTSLTAGLVALATIPLPIGFGFAALRTRLLDIDMVVNRSVVYTTLTGMLVAVSLFLIHILTGVLVDTTDAAGHINQLVVVFLSALAIAVLANPLRCRLQSVIDRLFFRRQVDAQRALRQWSEELGTSLRFSDLARVLTAEIPRTLRIDGASMLVLGKDEASFEPYQSSPLPLREALRKDSVPGTMRRKRIPRHRTTAHLATEALAEPSPYRLTSHSPSPPTRPRAWASSNRTRSSF